MRGESLSETSVKLKNHLSARLARGYLVFFTSAIGRKLGDINSGKVGRDSDFRGPMTAPREYYSAGKGKKKEAARMGG